MFRVSIFQRLIVIVVITLTGLTACRAPFQVRVTDFRGGARPSFYEGEALKMYVDWDKEDREKAVSCQVLDTYSGESKWEGQASIPAVENSSLEMMPFDPPPPFRRSTRPEGGCVSLDM